MFRKEPGRAHQRNLIAANNTGEKEAKFTLRDQAKPWTLKMFRTLELGREEDVT